MRPVTGSRKEPLIVPVELDSRERYQAWLRYRDGLLGSRAALDGLLEMPWAGPAVIWRLFSAGRRDVCGSASLFPDTAAAEEDALRVIAEAATLQPVLVGDDSAETCSWYLVSDGGADVLSHCTYTDRRERDVSVHRATGWLATARPDTGESLPRWFDTHRLPMLRTAAELRPGSAGLDESATA